MEMASGIRLDEFGQFAEEVLNAGGLPPAVFEQLGLQQALPVRRKRSEPDMAPDAFLAQIYRYQE